MSSLLLLRHVSFLVFSRWDRYVLERIVEVHPFWSVHCMQLRGKCSTASRSDIDKVSVVFAANSAQYLKTVFETRKSESREGFLVSVVLPCVVSSAPF